MTNVKRLIILDLNGFLIHRVFKDEYAKSKHLLQQHYRLKNLDEPKRKGNFAVWLRPHTETFLPWLMDNFHVAIWSSVLRRNLEPIIEELFQRQHSRDRLLFFWDQEKCWTEENPDETDPKKRQSFYKRLSSVWDSAEIEERWLIGQPEDSDIKDHTLLIDDNKLKVRDNPVNTAIHPRSWKLFEVYDAYHGIRIFKDDVLSENGPLRRWLEGLREWSGTVTEYVERNPYNDPPLEEIEIEVENNDSWASSWN